MRERLGYRALAMSASSARRGIGNAHPRPTLARVGQSPSVAAIQDLEDTSLRELSVSGVRSRAVQRPSSSNRGSDASKVTPSGTSPFGRREGRDSRHPVVQTSVVHSPLDRSQAVRSPAARSPAARSPTVRSSAARSLSVRSPSASSQAARALTARAASSPGRGPLVLSSSSRHSLMHEPSSPRILLLSQEDEAEIDVRGDETDSHVEVGRDLTVSGVADDRGRCIVAGHDTANDEKRTRAAESIQRWYRRLHQEREDVHEQVRRMIIGKRREWEARRREIEEREGRLAMREKRKREQAERARAAELANVRRRREEILDREKGAQSATFIDAVPLAVPERAVISAQKDLTVSERLKDHVHAAAVSVIWRYWKEHRCRKKCDEALSDSERDTLLRRSAASDLSGALANLARSIDLNSEGGRSFAESGNFEDSETVSSSEMSPPPLSGCGGRAEVGYVAELAVHAPHVEGEAPYSEGEASITLPKDLSPRLKVGQESSGHLPAEQVRMDEEGASSLLKYLDEAERAGDPDDVDVLSSTPRIRTLSSPSGRNTRPTTEVLAASQSPARSASAWSASQNGGYDNIRARLVGLKEELRAKEATLDAMRQAQNSEREVAAKEREQNESAVARHLAFADRLLKDKDELTRRLSEAAEAHTVMERKHAKSLAAERAKMAEEIGRQKELWATAERIRREAWQADKVREIKEATIRGLEPEIQRVLARAKEERRNLEATHQEALRSSETELSARHEEHVRQLREGLRREKEEALEAERASSAQRQRDAAERAEQQLLAHRQRWMGDLENRLAESERARRDELRRAREELEEMEFDLSQRARQKAEAHESELRSLRQTLEAEDDERRARALAKMESDYEERLAQTKLRLTAERDAQIKEAVLKLEELRESDSIAEIRECQRREKASLASHRAEIQALRSDIQAESSLRKEANDRISALENDLRAAEDRASKAEALLEERDANIRATQKEIEASSSKSELLDELQRKLTSAEIGRADADAKVKLLEGTLIAERERHSEEITRIGDRVKAAVETKDAKIRELQFELDRQTRAREEIEAELGDAFLDHDEGS